MRRSWLRSDGSTVNTIVRHHAHELVNVSCIPCFSELLLQAKIPGVLGLTCFCAHHIVWSLVRHLSVSRLKPNSNLAAVQVASFLVLTSHSNSKPSHFHPAMPPSI